MAIDFAVGGSQYLTKHPRVIFTTDGRGGCPPASGSGASFWTTTVTTTVPAIFFVASSSIRLWADGTGARCDLGIRVDGLGFSGEQGRNLQYQDSNSEWQTDMMYHAFTTTSTGTISISSFDATGGNCGNRWGCGGNWGGQIVMVFE